MTTPQPIQAREDGLAAITMSPTTLNVQVATPWSRRDEADARVVEFRSWFERAAYLALGTSCNQSCRYCFQDKAQGWEPLEKMLQHIELASSLGVTAFHLIGGEPLIYPHFWDVVDAVRRSDVPRWGIMTNGMGLGNRKLLARLVEADMGFVHISFDSPRPEVQNRLARNPALFERLERAFENLAEYPHLPLMFNSVVTSENVDHLTEMVEYCAELQRKYGLHPLVSFTQTKPGEFVEDGLVLPASVSARAVVAAIERGKELGVSVWFRNLPYCLTEGYEEHSTDWTSMLYDVDEFGRESLSHDLALTKLEQCLACVHLERCPGVQEKYVARFGSDEFRAVEGERVPLDAHGSPIRTCGDTNAQDASTEGSAPTGGRGLAALFDGGDRRVQIGDVRQGEQVWLDVEELEQTTQPATGFDRTVLTGPEVMLHPDLPAIIARFAEDGPVWIETTGLALARPEQGEILASHGLEGICWLQLPDDAHLYRKLLRRGRVDRDLARTAKVAERAGLAVEHRFPLLEEPVDALIRRIEAVEKAAGAPDRRTVSAELYHESWHRWLDAPERTTLPDDERAALALRFPAIEVVIEPNAPTRTPAPGGPDRADRSGSPQEEEAQEQGVTVSVLLGTKCNFRCEFCYLSNHKTGVSREDTVAAIERVLDAGVRNFYVAGGEPTLFPHFFPALEALATGDTDVTVVTNGTKFSDPEFARRVWDTGIRNVLLSFHSHDPEIYDALAQRKNVFPNIIAAYETIRDTGFNIAIHHVLYERNYRVFPEFVQYYVDNLYIPGRTEITVSNVLLVNESFAADEHGIPKLTDILPYYREGIELAARHGVRIGQLDAADGFPECVYGERESTPYTEPQGRWILEATPTSPGLIFAGPQAKMPNPDDFGLTDYNTIFTAVPACASCSRRETCIGVQAAYVEHYGDSEFKPI